MAKQLTEFHPNIPRVILVASVLNDTTRSLLASFYDEMLDIEELIESTNLLNLKLFGRLDLKYAMSKIYIFNLTQFDKLIYLDADMLPLRPLPAKILELQVKEYQLAASPDASWPDIFNSGFMILKPSESKFVQLTQNLDESFDGADQGLLNQFFTDWVRLPFIYNVTLSYGAQVYEYLPLLNHFKADIYSVHFIGPRKPWMDRDVSLDSTGFYSKWWELFNISFTDLAGEIFNTSTSTASRIAKKSDVNPFQGGPEAENLQESKLINKWDSGEEEIIPEQISDYPPPIFPWEERRIEPTRVFGPDSEYLDNPILKLSSLDLDK